MILDSYPLRRKGKLVLVGVENSHSIPRPQQRRVHLATASLRVKGDQRLAAAIIPDAQGHPPQVPHLIDLAKETPVALGPVPVAVPVAAVEV